MVKVESLQKRAMCGGDGDVVVSKMEGKDFTKTFEFLGVNRVTNIQILYNIHTHIYQTYAIYTYKYHNSVFCRKLLVIIGVILCQIYMIFQIYKRW